MTEPLPNCFSIWPSAAASAFLRFSSMENASMERVWNVAGSCHRLLYVYTVFLVRTTRYAPCHSLGVEQQTHRHRHRLAPHLVPITVETPLHGERPDRAVVHALGATEPYQSHRMGFRTTVRSRHAAH